MIKHSSQKLPINLTEHTRSKQGFAAIFRQTDKGLPVLEPPNFEVPSSISEIWGEE